MSRYVLYVHPTCWSSYRVVKHLISTDLLSNEVRVVSLDHPPDDAIKHGVLSVPLLASEGEALATDPLKPELVAALLRGGDTRPYVPRNVEEAYERLVKTVLASSYMLSVLLVHEDLGVIARTGFLRLAARTGLGGVREGELLNEVVSRGDELLSKIRVKGPKALAYGFVRELYWVSGPNIEDALASVNASLIGAWLLAKVSVGRAGIPLPQNLGRVREVSRKVTSVLLSESKQVIDYVVKEQETILRDEEYLNAIKSCARTPRNAGAK